MLITKKRFFSLAFLLMLGILQISTLVGVKPVQADESLLNSQTLLTQTGDASYGANQKDVKILAIDILNFALGFLSLGLLILFFIAGFQWMTAGGNEDKIKKAKAQMINALIGLVIILSAWGITKYVIEKALCVTGSANPICINN